MRIWNHMKLQDRKLKRIIRSDKGETITESIASLLVFMVLLLAVTTMTQTALKMTRESIQTATDAQEGYINNAMLSGYVSSGDVESITFKSTVATNINTTHEVLINNDGGIIAFTPKE